MTLFELRMRECVKRRKNVTQRCVAQRLHISPQKYSRIERGDNEPTILEASKLAMIFGVRLAELVQIIKETMGIEEPESAWDQEKEAL